MKSIKRFLNLFLWTVVSAGLFYCSSIPSFAASNLSQISKPTAGDYQAYGYTGSVQSFTAPVDGVYKLEAWGALGGGIEQTVMLMATRT